MYACERGDFFFYQSEFPLCIPAPRDELVLMHPDLSDNWSQEPADWGLGVDSVTPKQRK